MRNDISIRLATSEDENTALSALLTSSFPDEDGEDDVFRQKPNLRFLAFHNQTLVGHIGLDLRIISVGSRLIEIAGIVDLCVATQYRSIGLGSALLKQAEQAAHARKFIVLFSNNPAFYERRGYTSQSPALMLWLHVIDTSSHSISEKDLSGYFMIKQQGPLTWPVGTIDLLGTLF